MTMVVGGSNGVTYPDSTNTTAANVTVKLSPALTDSANVLTINSGVIVGGTSGLRANGITYTTAP